MDRLAADTEGATLTLALTLTLTRTRTLALTLSLTLTLSRCEEGEAIPRSEDLLLLHLHKYDFQARG